MRNKLCVYYWNVSCPPSTGSKCEMLVCMKLLLFIVGAEHIPGAAATTDQKTWPRTKKLNPPPIFWRLVWLVFEIDFEINFDHEQMGPPPPLRLSLLLFSCCPSDVFVLIFRTRRPQGGGAGTLETFWRLWRGSLSYQSYATELCNCRKKKTSGLWSFNKGGAVSGNLSEHNPKLIWHVLPALTRAESQS